MKSKLFQLLGLMILALLLSGCLNQTQAIEKAKTENVTIEIQLVKDDTAIFSKKITVQSGTNALDALKQELEIEYKTFAGMGAFVTAINGIKSNEDYFWALYVNDQFAEKAIDAYTINENTKITWKYEKIDLSKLQ